jgi:hypothetical protein
VERPRDIHHTKRGDRALNERQHLSMWRLSQHPCGDPAGDGALVINFQFARNNGVADAVRQMVADPRRHLSLLGDITADGNGSYAPRP